MPTSITTDEGATITLLTAPVVEVSDDISNPASWTVYSFLWCDELKLAVNAYDTAKLHYEIGSHVLQPGGGTITDSPPLSLRGKYVRITTVDLVWVGYVLTDQAKRDGVKAEGGGPTNKYQGECQEFQVVGLEWWLDRVQVETSFVTGDPDLVEIQRALKFNGGESCTIDMKAAHRGNRAENPAGGYYQFTDNPTTDFKWTAAQIVEHLLFYQSPEDKDSNFSPCPYVLSPIDANMLAGFHPTVTTEHQTVFALLNKIIAPQRGLCWWLEFDSTDADAVAYIRVASLARSSITLTDGVLPANPNQITLHFDGELDVKIVDITNQGKRNYHRVICRGARQTVTFTVGVEDETLEEDWTEEAEEIYNQAAVADSDYGDLTEGKKKDRNDAFRKSDLLSPVYSNFRIPRDWDGKSGDGGTAGKNFAIAEISPTGSVLGGLPLTAQGIRLLNRTRLKRGVDYSNPSTPVSNTPDGSLEEFLPTFALLKVEKYPPFAEAANPDRWQYCEKMDAPRFHAGTRVGPLVTTTYNMRPQEHVPGIFLNANGMQHAMALNHFDTGLPEPSRTRPEVSYDNLRATVCAEADYYATGIAEIAVLPAGVPIEELIIDLGDDYRLDFLAENTIVDLKAGVPVLAGSPAVLRDDRKTLTDIAKIALEWYREDRQQMTVEFRQLRNLFNLGQLVTSIGEGTTQTTINTAISVLTFNFKQGTTTVQTMDDTLDLRALRGGGIT